MHSSLLHLLLKNGDFLNTDISQGSVATRLGCDGVFIHHFVTNFLLSLTVKKNLKIGKYLVKLWARVRCLVFFDSQCRYSLTGCREPELWIAHARRSYRVQQIACLYDPGFHVR